MQKINSIVLLFVALNLFAARPLYADQISSAEAEDGTLSGVSVSTSLTGYTGTGYVSGFDQASDQVRVTLEVPEAGLYSLQIRYNAGSKKIQNILVNGKPESSVEFPGSGSSFVHVEAGTYRFNQGDNTVSLQSNWGWINVDRFELHSYTPIQFQIEPSPVDGAIIPQARSLYDFLRMQFGSRMISGQTSSYFDNLAAIAGNTPMLRVGDLSSYTEGYPYAWNGGHTFGAVDDGTVDELIDWYNGTSGKGMISLQWHWHSPSGGEAGNNNFYTDQTDFDIRRAVTTGTQEYADVIRDIDAIAVQLRRFENEEIPVIWRPLHEAGGGWFWWGAHGSAPCLELYQMIFDRLTNFHGIHNLIWAWSTPEEEWYPGNATVDIVGYDSYPGNYNYGAQKYWFDRLARISQGMKLIAMTENGPIPSPEDCFNSETPWLYFMSWSNLVEQQNEASHIQEVFADDRVLKIESTNAIDSSSWRSTLYPESWIPGFRDAHGRYLHDFSYAGYMLGDEPIPDISGPLVDITAAPYLADNTGTSDVTALIQQALDDVGLAGGGVAYLPPGTYRIRQISNPVNPDAALHLKYDGVVLRGAGPDSTFIFHDQNTLRAKDIVHIRKSWSDWFTPDGSSTKLSHDLIHPSRVIPMESVEGFQRGDLVVVRTRATAGFIEEHGMEGIWTESAVKGVAFLRKIDSVDHEQKCLILDVPTRYAMKLRDDARVYKAKAHITQCGIENLSIGNRESTKTGWEEESYVTAGTGAYDAHYSHAFQFKYAQDCWIRNVHTYKPTVNLGDYHLLSNCLLMYMSRNITVDSCNFQKPQYEGGGGNGYMYTLAGNDLLVKNSRANHSRHNYDFKYAFSSGNVILNCVGENPKYSSDYHMYLSLANLIDGFTSIGDYLEASFRPWGGSAIHGYAATQSVFYNTRGEHYHPDRDYLILSKQFGWGYVIGTSGPADRVETGPVSGSTGGYAYDTSPRDFVEGSGRGETLVPASLYLDQKVKRARRSDAALSKFRVTIQVVDDKQHALEGATIVLNGDSILSDADGLADFEAVPELFTIAVSMPYFSSVDEQVVQICSDTTLSFQMNSDVFTVTFRLLDEINLMPFWGVSVVFGEFTAVSDESGEVSFSVPMGPHAYSINKLSYRPESGTIEVASDTLLLFHLVRTSAFVKFRLRKGNTPINHAWVILENEAMERDSLETDNMGIAKFNALAVNKIYEYQVLKPEYQIRQGVFSLLSDSTIQVEMEPEIVSGIENFTNQIGIWPNPVEEVIHIELPGSLPDGTLQISNIYGQVIREFTTAGPLPEFSTGTWPAGIYLLTFESGSMKLSQILLKH